MRTIRVVAAVIRDSRNRIFATARGYGKYKGGWEFPGGKIEPGETPQEALVREIREELDTEIRGSCSRYGRQAPCDSCNSGTLLAIMYGNMYSFGL